MSLRDTATIVAAGNKMPCFDSQEQVSAFEDADARRDDSAKDAALNHAIPLHAGDTVRAIGNATGFVEIEILKTQKDCWDNANAEIVKNIQHHDSTE